MSALSRIAIDDHRHVSLAPDDVVVFSSREIPGNERSIDRVVNHIARRGADIVHEGIKHVHVSGHGSEEELKLMLSLVRPALLRPDPRRRIRQRARHARIGERLTRDLPSRDRGHRRRERRRAALRSATAAGLPTRCPPGACSSTATRVTGLGDEVLRDRRHLAEDGLIVPVLAINKQTGMHRRRAGHHHARPGRRAGRRQPAPRRGAPDRRTAGGGEPRGTHRLRHDEGQDQRRAAAVSSGSASGQRPLVLPVIMEI